MNFYDEWEKCCNESRNDQYYINSFLFCSANSIDPLERSSDKDIKKIIEFIITIDKEKLIDCIDEKFVKPLYPSDVIQFSNFNKATSEITHILKYEENGLTFEEIGYFLSSADNKVAGIKYGENQSKTAKDFNLVNFTINRPIIVTNTALGNAFPFLDETNKKKLLGILSLRNNLIQVLIARSKNGEVYYNDVVSCLAKSTAKRRHNNVKLILDLAIANIDKDYLKNIIF